MSSSEHINFLSSCLSAKITNKFKSNIEFYKSLYADTGKLGEFNYAGVQDRALKLYPDAQCTYNVVLHAQV